MGGGPPPDGGGPPPDGGGVGALITRFFDDVVLVSMSRTLIV